jgi:acetylornithine deacetylase
MLAAELISYLISEADRLGAAVRGTRAARFTPPYTTVSVNTIVGGTATNILAGKCEFTWDIRALPGESPDRLLESLAKFAEGRRITVETTVLANVPPLEADGSEAESFAQSISEIRHESTTVPFATEGGQFQRAGWSTVVCGPGSIEQAHKPNEFIEHTELTACESFLDRAIARQCVADRPS